MNSTIGYAVSKNLKYWNLMKPLSLPANATQFELPALIKKDDGYVLMVVVYDGSLAIENPEDGLRKFGPRHQYLLAFKTKDSIENISSVDCWEPMTEQINKTTQPLKDIYGITFKPLGNQVYSVAYHESDYTLTDVVKVYKKDFPVNFLLKRMNDGLGVKLFIKMKRVVLPTITL